MSLPANLVFFTYSATLVVITAYCLSQLHLLWHCKKSRRGSSDLSFPNCHSRREPLPFVTVQLPVFNEMYVAGRLVDCMTRLDYPNDRFEIHVLDDSTDETSGILRQKVAECRAQGFQIEQFHRSDREGFKAGALKAAMPCARGEFIAIFDADFLPNPDFLKKTLPHFSHEKTGAVQTRWAHLNERFSLVTRLQAMQLNVHFRVEQAGRRAGGYLLQFNGTAGVWRKAAIEDAGGWSADTLTEDLDLSVRAQLRGWKIEYLDEVASPAELPAEMGGLKSQQFRWMKGGAEVARKMLPAVWRSDLRFGQKLHATLQLFGSTVFVFVFLLGVSSLPALLLPDVPFGNDKWGFGAKPFALGLPGLAAFFALHFFANVEAPSREEGSFWKKLSKFLLLFPLFMALSMGLSLHNSVAVAQGWLGRKSAFVRTPKFNIRGAGGSFRRGSYQATGISWITAAEGLLALCFAAAAAAGLAMGKTAFLWLHAALAAGYGEVFFYTLRHLKFK